MTHVAAHENCHLRAAEDIALAEHLDRRLRQQIALHDRSPLRVVDGLLVREGLPGLVSI